MLTIEGLAIDFDTGSGPTRALHGFDLTIGRGEAVGIVGESGSGKSITWLAALGLLGPRAAVRGRVRFEERDILGLDETSLAGVRGKRIAMIFQDPTSSLNPVRRVGQQIAESVMRHRGMGAAAARAEARRLLERVQIANPTQRLDEYPHELSGGMNQRVMIAMALAGEPDLLIADEPTTALDVTIQAQILELLKDMRRETGMALVIISHDLGVVAELADRVTVMYAGRAVETAPMDQLFDRPVHPYTQGLLHALPDIEGPRRKLTAIPGQVPEPAALPPGCAFGPRCGHATTACTAAVPAMRAVGIGHHAACLRIGVPATQPIPVDTAA
ncbi:MAG: ABC transporter ATP-binding protein [Hyphomicrobiaceae bacterium]